MSDAARVVIVTGASGGLGRAMVAGLLAAGARVVALDIERSAGALKTVVDAARANGAADRVLPIVADIRSYDACAAAVAQGIDKFGTVHALVNNAGLGMDAISARVYERVPFYELSVERWHATMETNINGAFHLAHALTPHLLAQGWGRIVNVVTNYRSMVRPGWSTYGASKAALETATAVWAKDLAETGVTVNALMPGGIADTPMVPVETAPDRAALVRPEVMVAPILWLTSPASDGVTGLRFVGTEWDPAADAATNLRVVTPAAPWPVV